MAWPPHWATLRGWPSTPQAICTSLITPTAVSVEVSCLLVAGSTSRGVGTVIATKGYTTTSLGITGVAVDSMGNIYIPDGYAGADPSRIIKVTAAGAASLLTPTGITFSRPQGVTCRWHGQSLRCRWRQQPHRRNHHGRRGLGVGIEQPSQLRLALGSPFGITVDPFGNLYIPDSGNNRILFSNVSGSALTFPSTATGASSPAKTATVSNLGNQPLVFSTNPTYTPNFSNNPPATRTHARPLLRCWQARHATYRWCSLRNRWAA